MQFNLQFIKNYFSNPKLWISGLYVDIIGTIVIFKILDFESLYMIIGLLIWIGFNLMSRIHYKEWQKFKNQYE